MLVPRFQVVMRRGEWKRMRTALCIGCDQHQFVARVEAEFVSAVHPAGFDRVRGLSREQVNYPDRTGVVSRVDKTDVEGRDLCVPGSEIAVLAMKISSAEAVAPASSNALATAKRRAFHSA